MNNYIVGIDPDTDKHGVALYENGKLIELHSVRTPLLYRFLMDLSALGTVKVSIENNTSISAIYKGRMKKKDNEAVKAKKAQHVGMCKQAQVEVEYLCEHLGIEVIKQRPSKAWKEAGSRQFHLITGWDGRSNSDQRSAAFMGYQALEVRDGNATSC